MMKWIYLKMNISRLNKENLILIKRILLRINRDTRYDNKVNVDLID
jgi:hypothetical protein